MFNRRAFTATAAGAVALACSRRKAAALADAVEAPNLKDLVPARLPKLQAFRPASGNYKIIHCVRHAQGVHNVAGELEGEAGYLRPENRDAMLTPRGHEQCRDLSERAKAVTANAQLLVVSPMHRTAQTALHSFPFLVGAIKWIANEDLREQSGLHPCDHRSDISALAGTYSFIDFSQIEHDVDPLYFQNGKDRETDENVQRRIREFLRWLAERPEREVIVVTHSAYLRNFLLLLGEERSGVQYENCEMRSYVVDFPPTRS